MSTWFTKLLPSLAQALCWGCRHRVNKAGTLEMGWNRLRGGGWQESGASLGWLYCQAMAYTAPATSCLPLGQPKRAQMGADSPRAAWGKRSVHYLKGVWKSKGRTLCPFPPLLCSFGSNFTEHILCTWHLLGAGDMGTNKAGHSLPWEAHVHCS